MMTEKTPHELRPKRIQRSRAKGWKMPENTVYVGRPTKWGNPYHVGGFNQMTHADVVDTFEQMLDYGTPEQYPHHENIVKELCGKNLACFCPLDKHCHADVLLRIANKGEEK